MFEDIEKVVSEYYGVEISKFTERDGSKSVSKARSMLWYVLHYEFKMPISKLAKRYQRSERNIKGMVSKMKFLVGIGLTDANDCRIIKIRCRNIV